VGVSIALGRQSRRHRSEMALECAIRGIVLPRSKPKIQRFGAFVCISTGAVTAASAAQAFVVILRDAHFREIMAPETVDFYSFLLAAGLTLVSAGVVALRANRAWCGVAAKHWRGKAYISSSNPCSGESTSECRPHSSPPAG
jgi:hypothetical protein